MAALKDSNMMLKKGQLTKQLKEFQVNKRGFTSCKDGVSHI